MKTTGRSYSLLQVLIGLFIATSAAYADGLPDQLPTVDGVVGFGDPDGTSWFAVWLPCPASHALDGVVWYNNDELVLFPAVAVGTGYADGPGAVQDMVVIEEDVSGLSSAWSTLTFDQPIAASQGGLYVTFTLPEDAACSGLGEGGGPGFGYRAGTAEAAGWLSRDGETWIRLHRTADFAMVPILVPYEEGMQVKSLDGDGSSELLPPARPYLAVAPNPFNPRTEIQLGVPRDLHVKVDIYDVRGRRVIRLVDGPLKAGRHSIPWIGVDGAGRGVASGVYFAHMTIGDEVLTRKMALIR